MEAAGPSNDWETMILSNSEDHELGSQAGTEDQWEMEEEEFEMEVEGEEWSILDKGTKERRRKISQSYPVVLPLLPDDIEQRLMNETKTYKPKKKDEDNSFESLAKKILENVRGKAGENITIDDVAEGDEEKRIYDVMNIFEGIGLTSKLMKKTYKCNGDEDIKEKLENLKEFAIGNDLESQISIAMMENSVLEFNQNKENQEEERKKTKDFHLTQLTEKILMIFLSLESSKTQFLTAKQILPLLSKDEGHQTSRGLQISKILVSLRAVGLLSVVGEKIGSGRGGKKLFYSLEYPNHLNLMGKKNASAI